MNVRLIGFIFILHGAMQAMDNSSYEPTVVHMETALQRNQREQQELNTAAFNLLEEQLNTNSKRLQQKDLPQEEGAKLFNERVLLAIAQAQTVNNK